MIKESLLYIGLSQALFAAFVLATRKKVTVSDLILVACLISVAVRFTAKIYSNQYLVANYTDFSIGIIPLSFGPFLYLYTKYVTRGNPPFKRKDLMHFIPIGLFFVLYFLFFNDQFSFSEDTFFIRDNRLWMRITFGLIFFTNVLLYTVFTYQLLNKYSADLKDHQASSNEKFTYRWLNFVSILFVLLFVSYFIIGMYNALTFSKQIDLLFISNIGLIMLVYSVSYFGIRQPSVMENIYFKISEPSDMEKEDSSSSTFLEPKKLKSSKVKLSEEEIDLKKQELSRFMEVEKPYLKSDLSLSELSENISISKTDLTYILNYVLGINFFTYVNNYRLQEVLDKLDDPQNKHYTILAIAFDCGFNSKSTFNSLFKQFTGETPSQYRSKMLEKSE